MDQKIKSIIERIKVEDLLSQGGFLRKRNNFSQVSNTAIDDESLTIEAKGLYTIIQRWITYYESPRLDKEFLRKRCKVGMDKFDRIWKELKVKGYLKQYRVCSGKTRFVYIYELLDTPDLRNTETITISLSEYMKNVQKFSTTI